jgi:hypothetical protein
MDDIKKLDEEQEGGTDVTDTGARVAPAIDSNMSLLGTRDRSGIAAARLRARGEQPSITSLDANLMADAIRTVESGGDYEAKGASGEYGAYQIMPATWKGWAGDLEQTPENQDKIVREKLGEWIKQGLTAEQIAAKWNSGSEKNWENKKGVNKKGVAYDVPAYVNKVIKALGPMAPKENPENDYMGTPISTMGISQGNITDEERLIIAHELGVDLEDVPTGPAKDRASIKDHVRGVKFAYRHADLGMEMGKIGSKMKRGTATEADTQRLEEIRKEMATIYDEVKKAPFVAGSFGQLLPFLVESAEKGGKGGLTGAMVGGVTGAAVGNLIPGAIALPEELLTGTGGAIVGSKIGSMWAATSNIADIEGGSAYLEFLEMGMDKDKAALASDVIGLGSGLLEMAQFKMLKRLIPGSDKMVNGAIARAIKKATANSRAGRATARLAGTSIPEAGVETVQEFWANVVELAASEINPELDKTDLSPKSKEEFMTRLTEGLVETFAVTATGIGVTAVPGVSFDLIHSGGNKKAAVKAEPGITLVPAHNTDKDLNLNDRTDASGNPNVKTLFGLDGKETTEATPENPGDGVALSNDLQTTPRQNEEQHTTNSSIETVVEDISLKKASQQETVAIQNNDRQMQNLQGMYNDAVGLEDHEAALEIAEQYKQVADDTAQRLQKFQAVKTRRLEKDKKLQNPKEVTEVSLYLDELTRKSGDMVTKQTQAVKMQEAQREMDFEEEIRNNPKVLRDQLVTLETEQTNLKQETAKLYRKVSDTMQMHSVMTAEEFYGRKAKTEKLLDLRNDLERKMIKEANDPKISGVEKAVDRVSLEWVDTAIKEKSDFDIGNAHLDRMEQAAREKEAAQKAAEKAPAIAEAKARAKGEVGLKRREVARETKRREAAKAVPAARKAAEEKSETAKRVEAIRKQKAQLRPAPKQTVSAERKAELEASKARKIAIEKQKAQVAKAERKPSSLPKKVKVEDLKKKEGEYVILTPDNPMSSKTTSKLENRTARAKFVKYLDEQGIDYEVGDHSMFEGSTEKPFILKGVSKKEGKKISDMLKQSSFIHAKGEFADLVEGESTNRIKKADIKVAPDATDYYTVVAGQKMTMPFFTEKSTNLDAAQMELTGKEIKVAKSKFRSAAIKWDGQIFEGPSHPTIIMQNPILEEMLIQTPTNLIATKFEHGFVGHDGKFTDRFTASREMGLKDSYLTSEDLMSEAYDIKAQAMAEGIDTVLTKEENKGILDIIVKQGEREGTATSTARGRQIRNIEAVLSLKTNEVSPKRKLELRRKLKDLKAGKVQAQKIEIVDFDKMKLKDKMGTLEIADALKARMSTGKHKFLFDRTKNGGVTTTFITQNGQYAQLESVKASYPNLKQRDDAISDFEGRLKVDPKTGQMRGTGGYKGVYLTNGKTAAINLPIISKSESHLDKAFETVIHEHVHGLVDLAMDDMTHGELTAFRQELNDLWESIPELFRNAVRDNKNTPIKIRTGINQIDIHRPEIITYALSHPEFANWLDSIPASEGFTKKSSKIKSIWDALVDLILTKAVKMPSKYDELQDILNRRLKFDDSAAMFSKEGKGRWKTPINKYRSFIAKNPTATVTDIVNGTGLTQYQVETLHTLLSANARLSKLSADELTDFMFGANVSQDKVTEWVGELDGMAVNAVPTTIVSDANEALEKFGIQIDEETDGIWIPEHQVKVFDGTKGKKGKTVKRTVPAQVIIVASNIQSQEHLLSKWMHEQVGHQGLRNLFGENTALFNRFLDQSYKMFAIKDKALLEEIIELYDFGEVNEKGERTLTIPQQRKAAEEVIARKAQKLSVESKKGLVNKFKSFLKRWLPKSFIGKKLTFTLKDNDIMNILEMAKENVITGDTVYGEMLSKALQDRAPRHAFKKWSTLPNFMFTNKKYKDWIREVEKAAPNIRKWYTKHSDSLHKSFGKDADLFNILLSVTSPNADVNTNVIFAVQTYAYLMGLTKEPGALFKNVLKKRIDEHWTSPQSMFRNLESTNFKVTEFVRGLMGDPDATVGDMWMFRAFFGDHATQNINAENFSQRHVVAMRQKLHDLAAEMSTETGETYTAREIQAAIWVHVNAKMSGTTFDQIADYESGFNKPSKKLDGKTPLQWLQDMVPNLHKGPLSERLGFSKVPMAPISPLAKQRILQVRNQMKADGRKIDQFKVDEDGTIHTSFKTIDDAIQNMIDAIVAGGRRVVVPMEAANWYRETFGFEGMNQIGKDMEMVLMEDAVNLFTDPIQGKITFKKVRDNLAGFSGTYTREAYFAKEVKDNIQSIATDDEVKSGADWLRTGNEGMALTTKIHEWRDGIARNIDRLAQNLEQQFLEQFNGRKWTAARVFGMGSKRLLHRRETELLQKAMNLYIDSGTGANRAKAEAYSKELLAKEENGTITNAERLNLEVLARMLTMQQDEIAWADSNIRPYYEDMLSLAREHKLIDKHVDNYVKRMWKMPKKYEGANVSWSGSGTSGFTLTLDSGKQRSFESIIDGWKEGMELKVDGAINNMQAYGNELGYTFANRRFVEYMRNLIDFKADGWMVEIDPKKSPDRKPPAGYVRVTDRGFAKPGKVLFAKKQLAEELNKLGERPTRAIWDKPIAKFIRKLNAMIKSTVLSVTMFHHLAGFRSYVFGVKGKGMKLNPVSAYRRGLKKLDEGGDMFKQPDYSHINSITQFLVQEGLTIGKTQDWDESAIQESFIENMLKKGSSKMSFAALKKWQALRRSKRSMVTGLFGRLFAGLKAESASIELVHKVKKFEDKHGRAMTPEEMKLAAQQVATLINADFGGLHLSRMGRSPDWQRAAQLILLAPDWTESNWRTVTGMIPGANRLIGKAIQDNPDVPGMDKVYRSFWGGILGRATMAVVLSNAAIVGLYGDDEDKEEYFNMLKEQLTFKNVHKGRWLSTDLTPIYKDLGWDDPDKRNLFSITGHFKDILKIGDLRSLVKHKISPVARIGETLWSGTDWKGARFTTFNEMFETGSFVAEGGKFAEDLDALSTWATLGSIAGYNVRQSFPIPASEVMQWAQGETLGLSAMARGLGLDVRDVKKEPVQQQDFEKVASKVNKLQKALDDAREARNQKLIFEARKDISAFPKFNQKKAKIGATKSMIAIQNNRIKQIKAKQKLDEDLTPAEEQKLKEVNERKQQIYKKAMEVLSR